MQGILRILKRIWIFNFIRRVFIASKYYNKKYLQIFKWGFASKEDTNFTYHLAESNVKYLAQTIACIVKKDYSEIFGYIKEIELNKDLNNHIISTTLNSKEKRFADKEVRFGRRLGWYAFVRAMKPKIVVETGVDKGLGSVLLCAALEKNKSEGYEGKYFGTDINPAAGYLLCGRYKEFGEILYGDSIQSLSDFKEEIDLFINDSAHSSDYEYNEYKTIAGLLNENSIILGDNSHCTDKLSQFSIENNRQFLFFKEEPINHWYPGAGIGISFTEN